MPSNAGVVVLLQDPATKVLVPGNNDLAMEIEQTGLDMPLRGPGGPGATNLQKFPGRESDGEKR